MRPDDKRRLNKGNPILQKGVVLNPKGRPVGSVNKFTALSRELMSTKGPDRILPTTKAVELRSQEGKGNVIINVGGLTEKIIEEDKKKPLDYEEGVIISEKDEDETLVKLGTNG